jgi:hypothetical protein
MCLYVIWSRIGDLVLGPAGRAARLVPEMEAYLVFTPRAIEDILNPDGR